MAVGALRRIRIYVPLFRKSLPTCTCQSSPTSKDFELQFSRSLPTCTGQSSTAPPTSPLPMKSKWSVELSAVEDLLNYRFKNKSLLEEALTHSSYTDATNYERLEFIGDAVLDLVVSKFIFLAYPDLDPGKLSRLRSANVCNEKLARAAFRHRLYKYVRYNNTASSLIKKVREFVDGVEKEDETLIYGGTMKAPKVLADIVESVAAAVFIDCDFNLETLWVTFKSILEPIIMLDVGEEQSQSQPVTMLFEACHEEGKQVHIKHWRKGEKDIFTVFVDGKYVASRSSNRENKAKLHAAKAALQILACAKNDEVDDAKHKLHELCDKKGWLKPT